METNNTGAARPAPRRSFPAAMVIPLVVVFGLGIVMMLGDGLETNPWVQGGVVVIGFLLLLAGGMTIGRTRK